jgi:hypothetical protein
MTQCISQIRDGPFPQRQSEICDRPPSEDIPLLVKPLSLSFGGPACNAFHINDQHVKDPANIVTFLYTRWQESPANRFRLRI